MSLLSEECVKNIINKEFKYFFMAMKEIEIELEKK